MNRPNFIDSLTKDLKPSPAPTRWPVLLLRLGFLSACIASVIIGLHGLKSEINALVGSARFVLESSMLVACIGLSFIAACLSAIPGRLKTPRLVFKIVILLVLVFLISLTRHDGWQIGDYQTFLAGMSCGIFIIVCSMLPLLWGFREIRRQASTQPRLSAVFLSLGVVSTAVLVQQLICPADDAPHLLVWHSIPLLILVSLSAWLGPKVFRW